MSSQQLSNSQREKRKRKDHCYTCGRKFGDGDQVIAIMSYVTNEKRGDFVTNNPTRFTHAYHLNQLPETFGGQ